MDRLLRGHQASPSTDLFSVLKLLYFMVPVLRRCSHDTRTILERCFGMAKKKRGVQPDGEAIRRLREERGWDRGQLEVESDVSKRVIDKAETNRQIDLKSLNKIAKAFDVGNEELINRSEPQQLPPFDLQRPAPRSGADLRHKQRVRYWETAPSAVTLHGRESECRALIQHSRRKSCRIIGLFGKGGIGKTALASAVMRAVADDFEYLYWHDLRNAPPVEEVLKHCLYVLSDFQSPTKVADAGHLILDLLSRMRQHRTLLVFDNFETIMEPGKHSYRSGYADYGTLIKKLGETAHLGCVILTSRERPPEWTLMEDGNRSVVAHLVRRLSNSAGAKILLQRGLTGSNTLLHEVVRLHSGNPAALKHISAQIDWVCGGDVKSYLESGQRLPAKVQDILSEQVSRLSSVERHVLYWLAIEREALTIDSLRDDLLAQDSKEDVANAIFFLLDHDLVQRTDEGFTLENLVLEYLTDRLVGEFSAEVIGGTIILLNSHALLVATSKEDVRASQARLLLRPVRDRLLAQYPGDSQAARYLWSLLAGPGNELHGGRPGYAAGNLINLLCDLGADFTGRDLSGLTIWQAYLREVALKNVSFRNTELAKCAFVETFSGILSVAVNSDGTLLATGDAHGEVLVWRVSEDQTLFRRRPHSNWVRCVAFSPDDRFLATGSDDKSVMVFRVDSGESLFVLRGHASRVRSVAWSHDSRFLASAGDDNIINLWSVEGGELILSIDTQVWSVAFLPDGRHLVSGGACVLKLWDLQTGRCVQTFTGHNQPVRAVAASPHGKLIASGSDDSTVRLWGDDGASLGTLVGHTGWVWSVAFSHDGKMLASGGGDRSARLWDLKTLRCVRSFEGHAHWVRSITFSGNDRLLVTGGDDRTIRMWDCASGQCVKILRGHSNPIWTVAFSPDKTLLASSGNDETIRLWDLATGAVVRVLRGHESWVWTVAFSPDGKRLGSASGDVTARVWDLVGHDPPIVLRGHDSQVRAIAFDPMGRFLATGSDDGTARVWDPATGGCLRVLSGHKGQVWAVAVSPDGALLATASDDHTVRMWDVATWDCRAVLRGHTNRILSVAFSRDGLLFASGSEDRSIRLWRAPFSQSRELLGHSNWVQALAFCRADKTLVSGSDDQSVILWDVASGKPIKILREHADWVQAIAATDDGTMFASGSQEGTIKVWDADSLECLRTLRVGRLYENMDITDVRGLTDGQIGNLIALGAGLSDKATGDLT